MPGKAPWKMAAGATAIALLAAGCGGGGSEDSAATSNTVVIGIGEPQHLIPTNATESNGSEVLSSLFYPLVDFDAENKPVVVAAESITPDSKNTVWTVKLKPGFTFSNGEPVTSENYINAWNYGAYGPNGQGASYFFEKIKGYADLQSKDPDGEEGPKKAPDPKAKTLEGLKKVDDATFTITLSAPFAGWESVMGYTAFYPLPKAAWKSEGVIAEGFEDAIIGNGPFKIKGKWEHDSQIVVEKVADFKGEAPKVDGVTWKIYQDQQAEYADLVAGNVDVQTQIPIESLGKASADLGDRFKKSPNSTFQFVGFPTFQKEYQDVRVRKAISMAINRQEITDQIFLGSQSPATSFVSPVVAGYRPDTCGANCVYNPSEAKKLYTEANGPKEIKITYNVDGNHKAWVDATCNQIKAALGINCVGGEEPKFADLLSKVEKKQPVGLIRLGWIMDYPLMENYLGPLYSTDGSSNYYGYSNPTFDNLVKEGSAAATEDEAIKKWQAAEDILAQEMPVIPLRNGQNVYGYSTKVNNVTVDLFQKVNLYKIEVVG
ncbi:peptide ABC transporter substrate-binding protein [Actinoplanes regularis]|uniref:Peptide/nickel transport system substrate-binding protein/oligopeptide transport system substrate-binding protein n=1 Tax=Actinoplanes regularis TaxID=52697 RepID=A0A238XEI9_9ACTN|nr:ABC transporter substrate-binding protein [Actinoplanes regularis]SNR56893.1 peptide/nickel transport system substrate-binding protein/oligopeptide transport system substrate-binding protein [Actinoplanes regularis]